MATDTLHCMRLECRGTRKQVFWLLILFRSDHHVPRPPCRFQAYAEQLKDWRDGADVIDPPIQFPPPGSGAPLSLEFSSWSAISEMCGDSRYWGGMHFEVSDRRGHVSRYQNVTLPCPR